MTVCVRVVRLPHGQGLDLPAYATPGSAGVDLRAAIDRPVVLEAGRYAMIPTGLALALPEGHEGQVRPRSGLAAKHGVTVLNSPGTVDSDYRGEVKVLLINHGTDPFTVSRGERIAQLVVAPVVPVAFEEATALDETERGTGGHAPTGRT